VRTRDAPEGARNGPPASGYNVNGKNSPPGQRDGGDKQKVNGHKHGVHDHALTHLSEPHDWRDRGYELERRNLSGELKSAACATRHRGRRKRRRRCRPGGGGGVSGNFRKRRRRRTAGDTRRGRRRGG
jgi:hypothetical protein